MELQLQNDFITRDYVNLMMEYMSKYPNKDIWAYPYDIILSWIFSFDYIIYNYKIKISYLNNLIYTLSIFYASPSKMDVFLFLIDKKISQNEKIMTNEYISDSHFISMMFDDMIQLKLQIPEDKNFIKYKEAIELTIYYVNGRNIFKSLMLHYETNEFLFNSNCNPFIFKSCSCLDSLINKMQMLLTFESEIDNKLINKKF